jgi:hypothetical protein
MAPNRRNYERYKPALELLGLEIHSCFSIDYQLQRTQGQNRMIRCFWQTTLRQRPSGTIVSGCSVPIPGCSTRLAPVP